MEKQIEEMAKVMCGNDCEECAKETASWRGCSLEKAMAEECLLHKYAKELFKQGYRKIDEGSIVWTKAEHEEIMQSLQRTLTNATLLKCIIMQKEEEARQARKETAKEILQAVKDKAWANSEDEDGNVWNWEITQTELDEIAKRYGVDL